MKDDATLVDNFVDCFEKLDDLRTYFELDPLAWELAFGESDEDGLKRWKPIRVSTERTALDRLYDVLPAPFPPLYEQLILSYRWAQVDLGTFRLLANPPSQNLDRLLKEVSHDRGMMEMLIPNGCLQFGKGPDVDYDAVCFDFHRRGKDGDCPVVKIDHEEILCNFRFRKVAELAPSFRSLMERVIKESNCEA